MTSKVIQELEANIRDARKIVDLGDALERLRNNRDFRKVVLEGFFEQEAIRLVHLKSDQSMQSLDSQKSIVMQMDAIGMLRQYFETLKFRADMARKSVEADEETRNELLAEDIAQ